MEKKEYSSFSVNDISPELLNMSERFFYGVNGEETIVLLKYHERDFLQYAKTHYLQNILLIFFDGITIDSNKVLLEETKEKVNRFELLDFSI